MTLKEATSQLPGKKLVRIGASAGNGFIYGGRVRDIPWDDLNDNFLKSLPESKRFDYIFLEDRDVVEIYPSLRSRDVDLIIFDGDENQDRSHSIDDIPTKELDALSYGGMEALSNSIYQQAVRDYYYACRDLKSARTAYINAVQEVTRIEKYLRNDVLGVISEPESVIEFTRKKVFGETMT